MDTIAQAALPWLITVTSLSPLENGEIERRERGAIRPLAPGGHLPLQAVCVDGQSGWLERVDAPGD